MRHLSLLAPLSLALLLIACGDGEPLLPPDAVLPDGGRYRGEVVDGLLQGPGRLDYKDGSYYQGLFKDGQFSGPANGAASTVSFTAANFRLAISTARAASPTAMAAVTKAALPTACPAAKAT